MKITPAEYSEMTKKASPNSKLLRNGIMAFISGGIICTIGQLLKTIYIDMGMEKKDANNLVSITLIALGALLTTFKIYDNIAKFAGAGTLVPITGFANSIVSPAIEFKSEGHIMGIGAKMFTIAGPVIVFGTTASIIYGIIISVFGL